MEPTQLQLVLNVVTITGITTLGGYCYLLKKENRKLAAAGRGESSPAKAADVVRSVVRRPRLLPAVKPVIAIEQDIRTFASARRKGWVNGLSSAMSHDGCY